MVVATVALIAALAGAVMITLANRDTQMPDASHHDEEQPDMTTDPALV